jgi:hypothetical protein
MAKCISMFIKTGTMKSGSFLVLGALAKQQYSKATRTYLHN